MEKWLNLSIPKMTSNNKKKCEQHCDMVESQRIYSHVIQGQENLKLSELVLVDTHFKRQYGMKSVKCANTAGLKIWKVRL